MGWFEGFRDNGWNTYYSELKTAAWWDFKQLLIVYFAAVLAAALLVIVIGTRGKERWSTLVKLVFNLHIGIVILVCVTGQRWQISSINTVCDYFVTAEKGLRSDIGINIGLKSINITLDASANETGSQAIHFNERFSFNHVDDMEQNMLEAKRRGLPETILYILEYFAVDGGGLRWTRVLRETGHFVYILLWSSLVSWLLSCVMMCFATSRGALLLLLTGALMFASSVTFHTQQPVYPLVVPFEDTSMKMSYGWCFWLCGVSGVLAIIAGSTIISVLTWCPEHLCVKLLGCGPEEEEDDMYDLPPEKDGPLQLDTPFQKRKKSIRVYKNDAYQSDENTNGQVPHRKCNGEHIAKEHTETCRNAKDAPLKMRGQAADVTVIIDSSDDDDPWVENRGRSGRSHFDSLLRGPTDHSDAITNDVSNCPMNESQTTDDESEMAVGGLTDSPGYGNLDPYQPFPESISRPTVQGEFSRHEIEPSSEDNDLTEEDLSNAGWFAENEFPEGESPDTDAHVSPEEPENSSVIDAPPGQDQLSTTFTRELPSCKTVIDLEKNEITYNTSG